MVEQVRYAPFGPALIFDSRAEPHVIRPTVAPRHQFADKLGPLGEQQPIKVWRRFDQLPQTRAGRIKIPAALEHISHGRAKYALALSGPACFRIPG
jgi:hypothetical protein